MKRHINMGSIGQFKHAVKSVTRIYQFEGMEDGLPRYNPSKLLPILAVLGTEKIHGTNAAVCYSEPDGFWVQSKERIITPEKDNAGCAFIATSQQAVWVKLIKDLAEEYKIDLKNNIISLYYEFCGSNIQKKSAVLGLDKLAIIFQHFKVSPLVPLTEDPNAEDGKWYVTVAKGKFISCHDKNIYHILDFPCVMLDIDFNNTDSAVDKMTVLTEDVENNSGVANYFNKPENVGEGYVWSLMLGGKLIRWKTKGKKHTSSKVKTLKPVNKEAEQKKQEFAQAMCPAWRLEQAWQTVFGINEEKAEPSEKFTGDFLRAVIADVMKEEQDALTEAGYIPKDVNSSISKCARIWFFDQLSNI